MTKGLISVDWVREHLEDEGLVLVDCRFMLGQPVSGRAAYEQEHLPGAYYADLEEDLSARKSEHGGRHPLPDLSQLSEKLGQMGVGQTSTVVAYDEQGGAMASRFWWLLQYMGHENVHVMDGGWPLWKAKGYPATADMPAPKTATFVPRVRRKMLASMEEVRAKAGQPGVVLLDSREANRYKGIEEPIDPVAGHIPGAQNAFWKDSLTDAGTFRSPEEQRERFAGLQEAKEIIVYCGSGVTACPNILALRSAGYDNVKLYAGSWSDWVSYKENPVELTKEEG